jgi:Protein of unknown function (DUF1761)
MIPAIESLRLVPVLVVSLVGFFLGALWFSPLLFVKAWLAEMKITPEMMRAAQKEPGARTMLPKAFALTVLSTFTLAALLAANHTSGALKGLELGIFVGVGIIVARTGVNAVFERRTLRHFIISSGHDVVLLAIQGAILGVWR